MTLYFRTLIAVGLVIIMFLIYVLLHFTYLALLRYRSRSPTTSERAQVEEVAADLGIHYDQLLVLGPKEGALPANVVRRSGRTLVVRSSVLEADRRHLVAAIAHADALDRNRWVFYRNVAVFASGSIGLLISSRMYFAILDPPGFNLGMYTAALVLSVSAMTLYSRRCLIPPAENARKEVEAIAGRDVLDAMWERPDIHRWWYDRFTESIIRRPFHSVDKRYTIPASNSAER